MSETLDRDAIARMIDDLSRADLGDPRRIQRAQQVARRLASAPGATIPEAMVTDAELEGAYRLFNNDRVSFEQLFDAHALGTADRASDRKLVLAIHDTTDCVFRHADPEEVGYLNTGKPGFPLHLSLLVDTADWRRPLGLTHAEIRRRETRPRRHRKVQESGFETLKKPDRESLRWFRGIAITEARLEGTATQIIHVADRESDSYELMATCLANGHRFLFRARTNRNVIDDGHKVPVRDFIEDAPVRLEREVPLSRRLGNSLSGTGRNRAHPPRESRVANLAFAATRATLRRPHFLAAARAPRTIDVNVLHVFEVDAPKGNEPVDWLLYTTEPLDTQDQIANVVDYYRCRWQIEELNKALKTGCVVQERQLESLDALTTMLAMSLPIAVELLALRAMARSDAERPASELLSASQLDALRHISHRELPKRPTAKDVLWCVAGLGGHIKNNGPAGWQVLQRGMEKFTAFAAGWCAREEDL
jgi:Transposase DNA-binding/Transposase DDE domain